MGPVVVLNCIFHGHGAIQPHMRWATGLLVDNCQVPEGGIDLMNRGIMGSGHGWTIGWSVVWNCTAKTFVIQQPPGSMNWAIGCKGLAETAAQPGTKAGAKLPWGFLTRPEPRSRPPVFIWPNCVNGSAIRRCRTLVIKRVRRRLGQICPA